MERVETLVIGAGVIGLAVARRLAQVGREVIVAEAGTLIGAETTRATPRSSTPGSTTPRAR